MSLAPVPFWMMLDYAMCIRRWVQRHWSHTCKTYPGNCSNLGVQHRRSLMLSLPEVSRQVLLNPDAMVVDVTPIQGAGQAISPLPQHH